jgi:hypothetical protein
MTMISATRQLEVRVDVSDAVGFGERLEIAATVYLPDRLSTQPVVCFAFPGGGYNRRYFALDVYDSEPAGQAGWHVARGWVFVACDYLNAGDSSHPSDPARLTFEDIATANHTAVQEILGQLAAGAIGGATVTDPFVVGIGHSLGGAFLIVGQGQLGTFDAIGVLGSSARHTSAWISKGTPRAPRSYVPRGTNVATLTAEVHQAAVPEMAAGPDGRPFGTPGFHFEDVSQEIVDADMIEYPTRRGQLPAWGSATLPPCTVTVMAPGVVAPEASMISCPIFLGFGERDLSPDPLAEPTAYPRATDATVFVCAGSAHMHNFSVPRKRMWSRLHSWADGLANDGGEAPCER